MQYRETPDILREIADQAEEAGRRAEACKLRTEAEKGYYSVRYMADISRSRTRALHEEIRSRLGLFCRFEMGTPSLKGLLEQGVWLPMYHVSCFGLMQEAVYERLHWETLNANRPGGPTIRNIASDPVSAVGNPSFFFEFMSLMNFEHDCQTDYH
jgi:hypothetical protein